jgi:uncharacterized protein (TIGR03067 family)
MKSSIHFVPVSCLALLAAGVLSLPVTGATEDGFKSLFNGKDLTDWEGLTQFWSVKDGAITGQTGRDNPTKGNTFIVWKGGEVDDFELRLSYKIAGGNSGIQYRSKLRNPERFVVAGYQADFEAGKTYSGILYEEGGRGILAQRGQKVVIKAGPATPDKPKIEVVGSVGDSQEIQQKIKEGDWNEYRIVASGNHLQHFINGAQTVDVLDEDTARGARSGILALQLHAGPPMTVQFKNIRIKPLKADASAKSDVDRAQGDWVVAELINKGDKVATDQLAILKLKIKGTEFTLDYGDGAYQGRFQLKESSLPKVMDVTLDDGSEVPAIYEMSASLLRVCYTEPGNPRPTSFESGPGSDNVLVVYKRKGS